MAPANASDSDSGSQTVRATAQLTADHRLEFRRAMLEALDVAARKGEKRIDIDLRRTVDIDASGIGLLVLLQKRARERGIGTRLLNAPRPIREMLHLTRLDVLFEFGDAE